jgi:hypothetical protein
MTRAQIENIAWYVAFALAGALVTTGLKLAAVLPGEAPIPWRELAGLFLLTFFGALTATGGAMTRPKYGHEEIASLADSVGHPTATSALESAAVTQVTGIPPELSNEQVQQIVAALHQPVAEDLERRMKAQPAESL